ncbi:hypothetical protein CR513_10290, partial [Mucuna pruriens]
MRIVGISWRGWTQLGSRITERGELNKKTGTMSQQDDLKMNTRFNKPLLYKATKWASVFTFGPQVCTSVLTSHNLYGLVGFEGSLGIKLVSKLNEYLRKYKMKLIKGRHFIVLLAPT